MFDYDALIEAGASIGLRVVAERLIPDTPATWNGADLRLWTLEHHELTEEATLNAVLDWHRSEGSSAEELRLYMPNNLVAVDERDARNADYVVMAEAVKWHPRFSALVERSRLPGSAVALEPGAFLLASPCSVSLIEALLHCIVLILRETGTYNVAHIRMEWDWYTRECGTVGCRPRGDVLHSQQGSPSTGGVVGELVDATMLWFALARSV